MKKILLLNTLLLPIICITYAQTLTVSAGLKTVDVKKGSLIFFYIDESPVPDLLYKAINFKGNRMAYLLSADYETESQANKAYITLKGQGYINEILGADIGAGIGYCFGGKGKGKITVSPELSLVYGFSQLPLGTLSVRASGSVYITVNNTQFDNYEDVSILLRNTYLTLKPGLKVNFPIKNKTHLRLYGGYQLSGGKSTIRFTGQNNNGAKSTEIEKLAGPNIYFTLNNDRISHPPFTAKGLEISIGVSFNL
jgi:hypothetical protein